MKTLGEKLRALRTAKNWSQEHVAHELNISLPAYSKIERNITDVSLSRLSQLGNLFGLSVVELLSYGDPIKGCKELLEEKDKEIMQLQKKVIELLEGR